MFNLQTLVCFEGPAFFCSSMLPDWKFDLDEIRV